MKTAFEYFLDSLLLNARARMLLGIDAAQYGYDAVDCMDEAYRLAMERGLADYEARRPMPAAYKMDADLHKGWEIGFDIGAYPEEQAAYNELYPVSDYDRPLYCPRGCNVVWSRADWDECAACGARMTPDDEDDYSESLIRAGQLQ